MMLELESTKNLRLSATTLERGSRSKLNLLHDSDFGIGNKKEIKGDKGQMLTLSASIYPRKRSDLSPFNSIISPNIINELCLTLV